MEKNNILDLVCLLGFEVEDNLCFYPILKENDPDYEELMKFIKYVNLFSEQSEDLRKL